MLKIFSCLVFLLTLFSTIEAKKGDVYPAEWKKLPALAKDYEVVQLTTNKAIDSKLYLKVNPYIESLNSIVFMSTRDKKENLYLISLDTGKITQLTESKNMDGGHANVSAATEMAFFREGSNIKSVSLTPPYVESLIYTLEKPYRFSGEIGVSSDGQTLALSLYDKDKNISWVAVLDVPTGKLQKIHEDTGRIDHVSINPVYANNLLYHVNLEQRVVVVDIKNKKATPIGENAVHSFWFPDGISAAYVWRGKGIPEQIVAYDTVNKTYTKYLVPANSNHFDINASQTVLQGDGGPKSRYIYYYPINPDNNTLGSQKMFEHGSSSSDELWHPHAAFLNDTDLLFSSDRAGNGDVYLLRKKQSN